MKNEITYEQIQEAEKEEREQAYESYISIVCDMARGKTVDRAELRAVLAMSQKNIEQLRADIEKQKKLDEIADQYQNRQIQENLIGEAKRAYEELMEHFNRVCKPIIDQIPVARARMEAAVAKMDFYDHIAIEYQNGYYHELNLEKLRKLSRESSKLAQQIQETEIELRSIDPKKLQTVETRAKIENLEQWKKQSEKNRVAISELMQLQKIK
jgi:hypothetical protein